MSRTPAGNSARPWFAHTWARGLAVLVGVVTLLYLVVPIALTYLAIGSIECLGPRCTVAERVAVASGAVSIVVGLGVATLSVIIAFRPRGRTVVAAAVGLGILPLLLVTQAWGTRTLSEGRSVTDEAMQVAFGVDQVMQDAVFGATGMTVWTSPGVLGPDINVEACPVSTDEFVAFSRMYFGPEVGLSPEDRAAIDSAVTTSTSRTMALPGDIKLSTMWDVSGDEVVLTVKTNCQVLPAGG